MIAHHVRRFTVSDLPYDLAPIEIDGRDGSIGRLDEGQAIDVQSAVNSAPAASGSRLAVPRWQRRIGSGIFAGTSSHLNFLSGGSSNVVHVRNFFWRLDQAERRQAGVAREGVDGVGLGIVGSSRPIRASTRGA